MLLFVDLAEVVEVEGEDDPIRQELRDHEAPNVAQRQHKVAAAEEKLVVLVWILMNQHLVDNGAARH